MTVTGSMGLKAQLCQELHTEVEYTALHYHMVKLIQNAVDNGCFCFDIPTQSSQDTSFVIKGTGAVKIAGINRKWKRKKGSF